MTYANKFLVRKQDVKTLDEYAEIMEELNDTEYEDEYLRTMFSPFNSDEE